MNGWDTEVGSGKWGRDGTSAAGSGYPEKKDEAGTETEEGGSINWPPVPSEQARTQGPVSEPSAVVMARPSSATATAVLTGPANSRRPSMAFEIARVERAGKISPPNPARAVLVWSLSRPRYIERLEQPGRRVRLLPGQEHPDAIPYSAWRTSWAQMSDFGLDVGMYFVTIAQLTGATLVYAALCVVAMVHFSSKQYSGDQVRTLIIRFLCPISCHLSFVAMLFHQLN